MILPIAAELFGIGYHSHGPKELGEDFQRIKQNFIAVRTFTTQIGNKNAIDVAAEAGLQIAAAVPLDPSRFEIEVNAVVEGSKRNPNTVDVIYVGNEDMLHGISEAFIIEKIQYVKEKLRAAGLGSIPVGTVQIDGTYIDNPGLAKVCDRIGVNIHPFFSSGQPIDNFLIRYKAMASKFKNIQITEIGWPTAGGRSGTGQVADSKIANKFLNDFRSWQEREKPSLLPYWFMYQDVPAKGGFETHFGLMDTSGQWKMDITKTETNEKAMSAPSSSNKIFSKCSALEENVDYFGNDIKAVDTARAIDCCGHCLLTKSCVTFSWISGTCWLKHTKGTKTMKQNVISAVLE